MSLHYFIDGYNLLRSTDKWGGAMAKQRELMLKYLEDTRPAGSSKNAVTIVFDGHPSDLGRIQLSTVRVLFSFDRDADSVIKDQVDQLTNARNAVVVTNDRSIQKWVKGAGAKVLSCEEFLNLSFRNSGRPGAAKTSSRVKPDPATTAAINAELRRLWGVKD